MTSPTDLAQLYILLSYEKVRVEDERQRRTADWTEHRRLPFSSYNVQR